VTDAVPDVNPQVEAVAPELPAVPDPADVTGPATETVDDVTGAVTGP
jgi:hypothetical protein